jgi:hypothetical protein
VHKRAISAVKRIEVVSTNIIYIIILRGRWYHIIVLNVHVPTHDKIHAVKDSYYKELERVFDKFLKRNVKPLLRDFNTEVGAECIFGPTNGSDGLHEVGSDSGVRVVNFVISRGFTVRGVVFIHRGIHRYAWESPNGRTHNRMDHVLIDGRGHSSVLDVQSFGAAVCDWTLPGGKRN